MKYLITILIIAIIFRPRNKRSISTFLLASIGIITLFTLTDSIEGWFFHWIIRPLLGVAVLIASNMLVDYIFYRIYGEDKTDGTDKCTKEDDTPVHLTYPDNRKQWFYLFNFKDCPDCDYPELMYDIRISSGTISFEDTAMKNVAYKLIDFSTIPHSRRSETLEDFLINCWRKCRVGYLDPMRTLAHYIDTSYIPDSQIPAYYNAAAYYYLYVQKDHVKATMCCTTCLTLLSCRNKNDLILNVYKWVASEPEFSTLFHRDGTFIHYGQTFSLKAILE